MTASKIKLWYCLAVAAVAAAIADPIVESASNAGWFGPGNFTDHSTIDVVPVLVAGVVFAAFQLVLRVRSRLDAGARREPVLRVIERALRSGSPALLPGIFALQLLCLFAMESCEQAAVYGHVAGGTLWLGGPVLISLAIHAVTCVAVAALTALAVRALARATFAVLRIVRALATLRAGGSTPPRRLAQSHFIRRIAVPVLGCRGMRAPPLALA